MVSPSLSSMQPCASACLHGPYVQKVRGFEGEKVGEAVSTIPVSGLSNLLTLSPSHLLLSTSLRIRPRSKVR
jgi:hypothetical protein